MNKWIRIGLVIVSFLTLILIRSIASKTFYDPFIEFFKNDYLTTTFPAYETPKLFINLFCRHLINTLVSLAIIYFLFQKKQLITFSIKLITFSIKFLFSLCLCHRLNYFLLLETSFSSGYLFAFYIRRMLIHPIFLLVLLPAFYYQNKVVS